MSKLIVYNKPPPLNKPPWGLIEYYVKLKTKQYLNRPYERKNVMVIRFVVSEILRVSDPQMPLSFQKVKLLLSIKTLIFRLFVPSEICKDYISIDEWS